MVRDVRGPSLAHSPSIGVLIERERLANDSVAGPSPSLGKMSRSKAGSSSKATPRTSTLPSGRKLANLLSSEANDTPVVTKGRRYAQSTPTMMRADETMLYDIAPPPDMPSSSLFGDESDDDTLTSPRSKKGNAVKGRGNLLAPVNSTLVRFGHADLISMGSETDCRLPHLRQPVFRRLDRLIYFPPSLFRKPTAMLARIQLTARDTRQRRNPALLKGLERRIRLPSLKVTVLR